MMKPTPVSLREPGARSEGGDADNVLRDQDGEEDRRRPDRVVDAEDVLDDCHHRQGQIDGAKLFEHRQRVSMAETWLVLNAAACVLLTVPRLFLHELWRDEAWLWVVVVNSQFTVRHAWPTWKATWAWWKWA